MVFGKQPCVAIYVLLIKSSAFLVIVDATLMVVTLEKLLLIDVIESVLLWPPIDLLLFIKLLLLLSPLPPLLIAHCTHILFSI